MKKIMRVGLISIVMLSGCTSVGKECPVVEECEKCENLFPTGLVLPQVFIMSKLYYTEADLSALETNVVEPLVAYFESLDQTVVSISIDNDNRGGSIKQSFIVEAIISDNDGNEEPIYLGFIHEKVNGLIPVWVMETME